MTIRHHRFLAAAACFISLLAICSDAVYAADPDQGQAPNRWGRVLALSFYDMTDIHGESATVRGPLSRKVFVTGKVASEADLFMNKMVERRLAKEKGLSWSMHDTGLAPFQPSTPRAVHVKAICNEGRKVAADHVLAGYLYAFRQRDGGNLGVQTPAKVAFELILIQVATERVVWQQDFKETQQALSDNLLNLGKFIKRKGRWIRAHQMAEDAVLEMLDEMLTSHPPPTQ